MTFTWAAPMADLLQVTNLDVHYGQAHALQGVSLALGLEPTAIVGRNGMGKTTLCQTIVGWVRPSGGQVRFHGSDITRQPPHRIARGGLSIVPQGRRCFPSLTVDEHLRLVSGGRMGAWTIERVYHSFPRLAERRSNGGTQLSGGEQQMLAIARALLMNPRFVIMDEPSEGLAPVIVDQLIEVLSGLRHDGIGLLLVEQKLAMATAVCDRVVVLVNGRVATEMSSVDIMTDETAQRRYLGVASQEAEI
jgi:branched-chain amino acid transport system ATP-binding protein